MPLAMTHFSPIAVKRSSPLVPHERCSVAYGLLPSRSMSYVQAAERAASRLEQNEAVVPPRERPSRWYVVGDPQTTPGRFFSVLDRFGLLGPDGLLAPGVGLVSMGDHFDFSMGAPEAEPAGREIFAWLVGQGPSTHVLVGNHDIARVAELAFESDETYARAKRDAGIIRDRHAEGRKDEVHALVERFFAEHPNIPSPGIVLKDFASFSEAQRDHVERALVSRRLRLAMVAELHGTEVLLTHAGITPREVRLLDVPAEPMALAGALEATFSRAIERVAPFWLAKARARLELEPLHVAGRSRKEGGGLLYHRPARRDREGAVADWEFAPESPRRFDPRDLPKGLVQMIGHSGHARTVKSLPGFVAQGAEREGLPLRTLSAFGETVRYQEGILPPTPDAATVYMVDPGFAHEPLESIALCEVDRILF
jgi:hypothetical protein